MGIPFEQSQNPLVHKHLGSKLVGTDFKGVEDVKATLCCGASCDSSCLELYVELIVLYKASRSLLSGLPN